MEVSAPADETHVVDRLVPESRERFVEGVVLRTGRAIVGEVSDGAGAVFERVARAVIANPDAVPIVGDELDVAHVGAGTLQGGVGARLLAGGLDQDPGLRVGVGLADLDDELRQQRVVGAPAHQHPGHLVVLGRRPESSRGRADESQGLNALGLNGSFRQQRVEQLPVLRRGVARQRVGIVVRDAGELRPGVRGVRRVRGVGYGRTDQQRQDRERQGQQSRTSAHGSSSAGAACRARADQGFAWWWCMAFGGAAGGSSGWPVERIVSRVVWS